MQQRGRRPEKFHSLLHQVFGGHKFIRSIVADTVSFQPQIVGIVAIGRKTCRNLFQAAFEVHFKTGITASYQTAELPFSHSDILTQHPQCPWVDAVIPRCQKVRPLKIALSLDSHLEIVTAVGRLLPVPADEGPEMGLVGLLVF